MSVNNPKVPTEQIAALLPKISLDSCEGLALNFPEWELTPYDYLDYAETSLNDKSENARINCVAHLKRAAECEMDTFLCVLGLYNPIKKSGIGFDRKLEFFGSIEVYNSRSLNKLNLLRNKIEHEYAIPDVNSLEHYLELVHGFVYALEGALFMLQMSRRMTWNIESDSDNVVFIVEYDPTETSVKFEIGKEIFKYPFGTENSSLNSFKEALRVYFWIMRLTSLISDELASRKLLENRIM